MYWENAVVLSIKFLFINFTPDFLTQKIFYMKKILFSLSFLGLFSLSFAQTVVWSDNFDDQDISDWTLVDADGDDRNWGDTFTITNSDGDPVVPISLISRSWQTTPLTPDNWAISPAIDLSNASGTIELSYVTRVPAAQWDQEHYTVYVATSNSTLVLPGAPIQLTETLGDEGDTGEPVNHTLDISSLAGESSVYVAFRHHDVTDMDYLSIDDVTVTAESLNVADVSLTKVSSVYPNPAKDMVNIKLADDFNSSKTTVTLTGVTGKQVAQFDNVKAVNVSNLPAGVYVMTITDGKKTEVKKLIKK